MGEGRRVLTAASASGCEPTPRFDPSKRAGTMMANVFVSHREWSMRLIGSAGGHEAAGVLGGGRWAAVRWASRGGAVAEGSRRCCHLRRSTPRRSGRFTSRWLSG